MIITKKLCFHWVRCFSLLFISLLVVIGCFHTLEASPSDPKNPPKTIRVVMDNNYPPYVFLNGKGNLQGILIDQWRLWEQKTGIKADIYGMDWGEALNRMGAGEFDVIDTIFFNEPRAKIYDFSKPYAKIDVSIFFHKSISGISDADSLQGFVVAVKSGDAAIDYLKGKGISLFQEYPSYETIIRAAKEKKVTVTVIDNPPALYFLYKMGIMDRFRCSVPLYIGEFHRAVKKGNTAILKSVEEGFSKISEKEYLTIKRKWFGIETSIFYPYLRHIGTGLGMLIVIVLLLIAWNRMLGKKIRERTVRLEEEITLNIKKTEALRMSEEKYRELVENANSIILRMDKEGRVTFFNEFAQRFFGFREQDIIGQNVVGTIVPEQETTGRDLAAMIVDIGCNPDMYVTNENENMRSNGERVWIAWTNKPIYGPNGNISEVLCVGNDITERKQAQEALVKSEGKYRHIFENAVEGIFQTTPDGRFISANPALASIHGYNSPEDLMDTIINLGEQLYVDKRRRSEFVRLMNEKGSVNNFEAQTHQKDGSITWVSINARNVRDENGKTLYFEGTIENITERKRLESQLFQSQKMESIGTLAGGIAHDFNNILSAIIGYSSLLQMKIDKDDPLRTYVNQILTASQKAANLTQSLLAFSRKQVIELKPGRVNLIIQGMEKLLKRILREDIELNVILADTDITIMADATQMDQVLMNLVTNARDAMPKGGKLTIETKEVEIDSEFVRIHGYGEPGRYVVISVVDTGIGMDEKTKEKIFEPFFTTKGIGKGTGLGLSIVYGIIQQHNGYIDIHSEPGKGTAILIYLPAIKSEVDEVDNAPLETKGGTETILVAEDNPELRSLSKEILNISGYTVIEAIDGEDAIRRFMGHKDAIDLLIIDVVMPIKNGKEVYEEISKVKPNIKILFISGYTADVVIDKGIYDDSADFISKPLSPTELLLKVREVLDR